MRCYIIPPDIHRRIEENGTEAQRARARKALLLSERIRGRREAAQHAIEPQHGERREVRDAQDSTDENGPVVRTEDTGDTNDPSIDMTYDHAGIFFDFLFDLFQRSAPDGLGSLMLSIIHYSEGGGGWDNAAFDGSKILVGDGDIFPPFWKASDVFYHEWAHWLTQATCNLRYSGEAGQNNEAGSDTWAMMCLQWRLGQTAEQGSWLIGEELFTAGLQGRGLRDMRNPGTAYDDPLLGQDPQIQTYDQYRAGMDPHIASSITNKAFVTAALTLGGKSWESVGPVWYDVWTRRLTATSGFSDVASATIASATERYGASSAEVRAWEGGWEVVKVPITAPGPAPTPSPIPSPCANEIRALLRDPEVIASVRMLAGNKGIRRLLARARLVSERGGA